MSLLLGYNTNGFPHHRLSDVLEILAETGYRSVGLTIDVHHPAPERCPLVPVIETGTRFLLDARKKHYPSLISLDGRERRLAFLLECVDVAARLGAPCVSLWSGRDEGGDSWGWLLEGLGRVCDAADAAGIDVAFEPEPGMFIDTMQRFDLLREKLPHPRLCLTLDVGHLHCLEEGAPAEWIDRYAGLLRNVHLDDHRRGVHEHLFFGEGEIDFDPVMAALEWAAKDRDLPATVELSRHGHDAVATCRWAFDLLAPFPTSS